MANILLFSHHYSFFCPSEWAQLHFSLPSHHPAPECNEMLSSVLCMEMLLRNLSVLLPVSRHGLIYKHSLLFSCQCCLKQLFFLQVFPWNLLCRCVDMWVCAPTLWKLTDTFISPHKEKLRSFCPVPPSPPVLWSPLKVFHRKTHVLVPWRALVKALQLLHLLSHHLGAMSQAGQFEQL